MARIYDPVLDWTADPLVQDQSPGDLYRAARVNKLYEALDDVNAIFNGDQLVAAFNAAAISIDGVPLSAFAGFASSGTPQPVGTAALGVAATASRSDHVHAHGAQALGDGTGHAAATTSVAGFMSATDKTKLDGIASGATATPLSGATPAAVGTATAGASSSASRADHVHAHGDQAGGSLHAITSSSGPGFYPRSNLAAGSDPGSGDDSGGGYAVGSRWINTSTGAEFVCVDASVGAAVWTATTTASAPSLATVLATGNTTGATDIRVTDGQRIRFDESDGDVRADITLSSGALLVRRYNSGGTLIDTPLQVTAGGQVSAAISVDCGQFAQFDEQSSISNPASGDGRVGMLNTHALVLLHNNGSTTRTYPLNYTPQPVLLEPDDARSLVGAPTRTSVGSHRVVQLSDEVTQGAVWACVLDRAYAGNGLVVTIVVAPTNSRASPGNAVFGVSIERVNAGLVTSSDSYATEVTGTIAISATANTVTIGTITLTSAQINHLLAGEVFRIRIQRLGGHGSDTYGDQVGLYAASIHEPLV